MKTNIIVVGNLLQIRILDFSTNLKLVQSDTNLPWKLRNLGVVYDENLINKYQLAAVKNNAFGVLINNAKMPKFNGRESKLKLIHC